MPAVSPTRVSNHNISAEDLDKHALDVIDKLNDAGFDAYLVGGCVRDALCGVKPKDFDVATNAKPEEVRSLFRRSRLVGRRFPIAHVRYGRNLIEVSTFRQGQHDSLEKMCIRDSTGAAPPSQHSLHRSRHNGEGARQTLDNAIRAPREAGVFPGAR